jgi:hypothetical protein
MKLRDSGDPLPAAAACLSPVADLTDKDDLFKQVNDPLLHPRAARFANRAYVAHNDARYPLISPVFGDWRGLPPLLLHAGEDEVLRDDAVRIEDLAKEAGVDVRLEIYPRMWHVWQLHLTLLQAVQSLDDIAQFLTSHLGVATQQHLKVIASGICGTDSTEYNVKNTGAVLPGHQFGHEFAGTVAEVGSEITGMSVGMRVTVKPLTATRAGRRNSCMVGGFSEYMLVENAAVGYNIYPLPEELSLEEGALVEPFSVGMHGVNLAKPQPKECALILGAGPIGLSALAGMKALGVESVVVSDLSEFRLQWLPIIVAVLFSTLIQKLQLF